MDVIQIKHLYKRRLIPIVMSPPFKFKRHNMKLLFASFQIAGTSRRSRVHIHTALLSTGIKKNFHEAFNVPGTSRAHTDSIGHIHDGTCFVNVSVKENQETSQPMTTCPRHVF